MKIKRNDGVIVEGDNILDCLDRSRVFHVIKNDDGSFYFEESCDAAFGAILTKEQVIMLANELLSIANGETDE